MGCPYKLVAAQMAKGSVCAMTGRYADAVRCFTAALGADPTVADAWKRRGQTQAARGEAFLRRALEDMNQAEVHQWCKKPRFSWVFTRFSDV